MFCEGCHRGDPQSAMGTPFVPTDWADVLAARERMQVGPGREQAT